MANIVTQSQKKDNPIDLGNDNGNKSLANVVTQSKKAALSSTVMYELLPDPGLVEEMDNSAVTEVTSNIDTVQETSESDDKQNEIQNHETDTPTMPRLTLNEIWREHSTHRIGSFDDDSYYEELYTTLKGTDYNKSPDQTYYSPCIFTPVMIKSTVYINRIWTPNNKI